MVDDQDVGRPTVRAVGDAALARTELESRAADAPMLELDETLARLVAEAQRLRRGRQRLRILVETTQYVWAGGDLDDVLDRVVAAAATITGARYVALGAVEHGRLTRFVHNMEPDRARDIGDTPVGKGLLGALARADGPVRSADLNERGDAVGFPDGHPPMTSFLGVPIRVRGRRFGALYLTDKLARDDTGVATADGRVLEFDEDDERLVTALARSAGVAIDHIALLADSDRRSRAQQAVAALSASLLEHLDPATVPPDGGEPTGLDKAIERFLDEAVELTGSAGAVIAEHDSEDPTLLHVTHAAGTLTGWRGFRAEQEGTLFALVVANDRPVVAIEDVQARPELGQTADRVPEVGPILAARFGVPDSTVGMLMAVRHHDRDPYTRPDHDLAAMLGTQAGLAVHTARARRDRERLAALDEREHLAYQLSDTVFNELNALITRLGSLASRAATPDHRAALQSEADTVGSLLARLRTIIFSALPDHGPH